MIKAIEHSGVNISSDLIQTKLIDVESVSEFDDGAEDYTIEGRNCQNVSRVQYLQLAITTKAIGTSIRVRQHT